MLLSIRTSSVPLESGQDMWRMISALVMAGIMIEIAETVNLENYTCGKFSTN